MPRPRIFAQYQTGQRHKDYGFFPQKGGVNILRDRMIECVNDLGFDGAEWHNPFGVKANPDGTPAFVNMSLYQQSEAEAEGFQIDVGRVTEEVRKATGKSVVHYYGTMPDYLAPDAKNWKSDAIANFVTDALKFRLRESIVSGAKIALDSVVDHSQPAMSGLAVALKRSRRLAGIEGWPNVTAPDLATMPIIITSERWQRLVGWPHEKVMRIGSITGERIIVMNNWAPVPGSNEPGIWGGPQFPNDQAVTPSGGWLLRFAQMWLDMGWSLWLPGELFRPRKINVRAWLKGDG